MTKNLVAIERARLGAYLKAKREKAKLSQGEVAKKLGYNSPQYISNMERGICSPTIASLPLISSLYKLPKKVLADKILGIEAAKIKQVLS